MFLSGSISGKLVDKWFGYRLTISIGTVTVAVGTGIVACSTIYELTLFGSKHAHPREQRERRAERAERAESGERA